MRVQGLIDTGALLALLDAGDRWHQPCVDAFLSLRLPLGTTAAVLAELFHLLYNDPRKVDAAWTLLKSEAIVVLPIGSADLPRIEMLMEQYADRPMDFADATLVYLAEQETLSIVFTVDHNDFETYRISGKQPFTIVPSRSSAT